MRAVEIGSGYVPHSAARTSSRILRGIGAGKRTAARSTEDMFERGEAGIGTEYTDYDRKGNYTTEGIRILPDRYYEDSTLSTAKVFYKGGSVTYLDLLEEAVQTGAIALDETKSVMDNLARAEEALIYSKAKPLYPWSTTLYSEDGQYKLRVENGRVTGMTASFYESGGKKITAQYLAEQLASGVRPADLDGDWSFLAHLDNELYTKACRIGEIKRQFEDADRAFAKQLTPKDQYTEDIHLYLLYFLGRDDGLRGAAILRRLIADPEFGRMALEGRIEAPAPATTYRRPVNVEPLPVKEDPWANRTRRRVTPA